MTGSRKSEPTRQRTTLLVAGVLFAVGVLVVGLHFSQKSGTNPEVYGNDFSVYYNAAREVIEGRDPYQHSLGAWAPYIYPPLFAELLVPLALLPLPVAAYLWFLISAASIAFTAWVSAGLAVDVQRRASENGVSEPGWLRTAVAACAVLLVFRFVLDTLGLGQVNGVVAALTIAHLHFYSRDRKVLSAFALVVAISIKLTPALFLLYHLAKLRLKFAVVCVGLLVAISVVSCLPFGSDGPSAFQTFVSRTIKNEQGYDFAYSGNQSLRGAVTRAYRSNETSSNEEEVHKPTDTITLLISIVFVAFSVFAAVRARSELAAAAPLFCCMVLISPLSWKAHYVILIGPAAHLVYRAFAFGKTRLLWGATLAVTFALFNLTSPRVIGLSAAEWADAHSLVFAGALVIFGVCLVSVSSPKQQLM